MAGRANRFVLRVTHLADGRKRARTHFLNQAGLLGLSANMSPYTYTLFNIPNSQRKKIG